MRIARLFTRTDRPSYHGVDFRVAAVESYAGEDASAVEVPDTWSQAAATALSRHAVRPGGVPARLDYREEEELPAWLWRRIAVAEPALPQRAETAARQVFDRVAGALTRQGWIAGYFDSEADALAFYDEIRVTLCRQRVMPSRTLLDGLGVAWAYGNAPEPRGYVVDFRTGLIAPAGADHLLVGAEAQEAVERPSDHVVFERTVAEWDTVPHAGARDGHDAPPPVAAFVNPFAFLDATRRFDVDGFAHAVRLWTIALDIAHGLAAYRTHEEAAQAWALRPIALSLTNVASLLMAAGLAYDSDAARQTAASVAALLTGTAYATSADLAEELGAFPLFESNREPARRVIQNHYRAAHGDEQSYEALAHMPFPLRACPTEALLAAARRAWNRAMAFSHAHGLRNATVSTVRIEPVAERLLDCAAPGLAPVAALVRAEPLPGGGFRSVAVPPVAPALRALGLDAATSDTILAVLADTGPALEAAPLDPAVRAVLAVAPTAVEARLRLIAAVQSFLSGTIEEPIALRAGFDRNERNEIVLLAWRLGLKALAIADPAAPAPSPAPALVTTTANAAPSEIVAAPAPEGVAVGRFVVYEGGRAHRAHDRRLRARRALRLVLSRPAGAQSLRLVVDRDEAVSPPSVGADAVSGVRPAAETSHTVATTGVRSTTPASEDADVVVQQQ
ncbi:MAG: hypothetical protein FJX67_08970 [Alphaproteobacteria bacterium]|nr:hypothetical protein [Alphaproteobacteria bacterium]